jgi:hypothetical protein
MVRDFFNPRPEERNVVLVPTATLRKAEWFIQSCEHCNSEGAGLQFDHILDQLTGSDPTVTDYLLEIPAMCPNCYRSIFENTLVEAA